MRARAYFLGTVSAIAIATAASAADLPIKAPAYRPVEPVVLANWTGFYLGGNVGVARHSFSHNNPAAYDNGNPVPYGALDNFWTDSDLGFIGGVQAGYNWQMGHFVTGFEGDFSWLGVDKSQAFTLATTATTVFTDFNASTKISWLATFRGRAGIAIDRTFLYVTGGLALADVEDKWNSAVGNLLTSSDTKVGWTAGGGVEHMFTPNWVARGEILYVDLGSDNGPNVINPGGGQTYTSRFDHELVLARVGLSYKW